MAVNIFAFVPTFRNQVKATTMLSTHALAQRLYGLGAGWAMSAMSFPDIADLRGMAVTYMMERLPEATHILFIDDDMGFKPEVVLDQIMFNEPLVGALYPKRALPIEFAGTGQEKPETRGGFIKVDGVGMGLTLIRRDCLDKMAEKMPELYDSNLDRSSMKRAFGEPGFDRIFQPFQKVRHERSGGMLSEDFAFCQRWRQCGGEVWAAGTHTIQHYGDFAYEGNFKEWSDQQAAAKAAAEAAQQAAE